MNRIQNKIGVLVVAIIVGVVFIEYIHTSQGVGLLATMIGAFPFADKILNIIKAAVGYEQDIPIVTNSSVFNDVAKLFVSSLLKMGMTSILTSIFCTIPAYDNLPLSGRIDEQEKYMNRFSYRAKIAAVNMVSAIVAVFISNEILKVIYSNISRGDMTTIKTLAYVGIVISVFFIYAYVIGQAASISFAKGLIFGFTYKLLPKLLDVFIIDVICIALYATIYTNGFGANAFGICIVLYAWCVLASIVENGLVGVFTHIK